MTKGRKRVGQRKEREAMWFGLIIMLAMVVGLVWWCVWAVRRDKATEGE